MRHSERGDTLIEVLIAIAILSLAMVGGLTAMNYGYSIANNAVERTQVQASMNGQLSMIAYARDAFLRANSQPTATEPGSLMWQAIDAKIVDGGDTGAHCSATAPDPGSNSFYVEEDLTALGAARVRDFGGTSATTLAAPGTGMWVEARRAGGGSVPYVDFYVKACWQAIGTGPLQQSRTVMRLYVP